MRLPEYENLVVCRGEARPEDEGRRGNSGPPMGRPGSAVRHRDSRLSPKPSPAANWVTLAEPFRILAFVLVFVTAIRLAGGRRLAQEVVSAERIRIANDLHDGLAQHLAFIVAYADRLERKFGEAHVLARAARRALAVSRGTIVDLEASRAPSTAAAPGGVARQLQHRAGHARDALTGSLAGRSADRASSRCRRYRERDRFRLEPRRIRFQARPETIVDSVRRGPTQIVRPRAASSRVASSTRSSACCCSSHLTSWPMPCSKVVWASNPSNSRARDGSA